jgi:hypothetical protein
MPIKNSPPVPSTPPPTPPSPTHSKVKKKSKTDRTLHFLSRIAESAFKEKFENMFEKLLKKRSS